MINQRKRVAKRLASGLMAGALAIGGLAITGAFSPAGAVPVELGKGQRLGGSDRYETSALVAEELDSNSFAPEVMAGNVSTVIVANGENYPDALAAASLTGGEAPIMLVKADSIPQVVSNRMSRLSDNVSEVYVIGGTSAVSADVFAQIESIFDEANVTRISGADRYATARAIADEVLGGTIIIASGNGYADAVSVGGYSAATGTPIILSGPTGLDADTRSWVADAIDAGDLGRVIIIGGTSAVSSSVETQLVEAGLTPSAISRVGGPDRYVTNLLWNLEEFGYPLAKELEDSATEPGSIESRGLRGLSAILVTGTNFPDALSASTLSAAAHAHIILTDGSATGGFAWTTLAGAAKTALSVDTSGPSFVTSALTDNEVLGGEGRILQDLWVVGGTAVVPSSIVDAGAAAADDTVTCSVIVGGANDIADPAPDGPESVIVAFSKNFNRGAQIPLDLSTISGLLPAENVWVDLEERYTTFETFLAGLPGSIGGVIAGAPSSLAFPADDTVYDEANYLLDNADKLFDSRGVDLLPVTLLDLSGDGFNDAVLLYVVGGLGLTHLTEGDSVSFDGWDADADLYGAGSAMGLRNFAPCEGTVARDRTAPTASVTATRVGGTLNVYAEFSESVFGLASFESDITDDVTTTSGGCTTDEGAAGTGKVVSCSFATSGSEESFGLEPDGYNDSAGNYAFASGKTVAIKEGESLPSAPTATATSSCVKMGGGGFRASSWNANYGAYDYLSSAPTWSISIPAFPDYTSDPYEFNSAFPFLLGSVFFGGGWPAGTSFDHDPYWDASTGAELEDAPGVVSLADGAVVLVGQSGLSGLDANGYSFSFAQSRGLLLPTLAVDGKNVTITIDRFAHTGEDIARLINSSSIGRGGLSPLWQAFGAPVNVAADQIGDSFTAENSGDEATQTCLVTVKLSGPMGADLSLVPGKPSSNGEVRVQIGGVTQAPSADTTIHYSTFASGIDDAGKTIYVVVPNTSDTGSVRVEVFSSDLSGENSAYRSVVAS